MKIFICILIGFSWSSLHSQSNFNYFSDLPLPKGVKIKELITELDLQWASKKLKNCMNNPGQNYKGSIEGGNTKLFVIITPNNMSGLELRLVEDSVFKETSARDFGGCPALFETIAPSPLHFIRNTCI